MAGNNNSTQCTKWEKESEFSDWRERERERTTLELGHSRTRNRKAQDVDAGKEKGCRRRQQLKMPCGFTTVLLLTFEGNFQYLVFFWYYRYKGKILYGEVSGEFSELTPRLRPHSLISRPHLKHYGHMVRPCSHQVVPCGNSVQNCCNVFQP